ncbi:MAG: DUF3843 family protein, partial [Muribaculaceae bacterium]|nr:DUF3843 family protein [Muribaculaceae bacterium]
YHIDELEWRLTHPQALSCASDRYYVKLVNRLIDRLAVLRIPNPPADLIKVMALSVAAYLEDLVNDFGVWNAFRNLYSDLYGSMLPFYNCDHEEYLTDNVNPEDLKFIVWQSFVRCGQPDERFFRHTARVFPRWLISFTMRLSTSMRWLRNRRESPILYRRLS